MLTIDWKERLKKDCADFVEQKLPKRDYDFEIIYKAYPARVNGKIPNEVISFVAQSLAQALGKNNEHLVPFLQYLWDKKGDAGKHAFCYLIAKYTTKKPEQYFPIIEKVISSADTTILALILEKILMPLIKKKPEMYLPYLYKWIEHPKAEVGKASMNALLKLVKKDFELIPMVLEHFQHQWNYPINQHLVNHMVFLKTLGKLDWPLYISVYESYKFTRDPQTVEILCGGIYDYDPLLYEIVENWTHSGNARLKKAAVAAFKILNKKK